MATCKLGLALGCEGMAKNGECIIYHDEGISRRVHNGTCIFKDIRSGNVGIYAIKKGRIINPLKAARIAKA